MRSGRPASIVLLVALVTGCQDDVSTPFPPGLEPLETNRVPDAVGPAAEVLRAQASDDGTIRVHGRGLVFIDPGTLWALTKQPAAMVARCSTDEQIITPDNDPSYEASFLVHYIARQILTVEWDDQWRYGVIAGTREAPELGMIKHQKTQGSDFITTSQGTVQILATEDPEISELAFVEHLEAVSGGTGDVLRGMQDNYNRLVALAHGAARPACP